MPPAQPLLAGQLARACNIPPLLAQCLVNRELSESAAILSFLEPRLQSLSDPFLLPQMDLAVERLMRARLAAERVVIFGDYDVDGVTSTALLLEVLRALGWTVEHYLPNRFDEGYGLSAEGVENCLTKWPTTLLLAVDCGSTAVETIGQLKQRGVDVLVLDHHQLAGAAPAALALVNPHAPQGSPANAEANTPTSGPATVRFTELCSVGLSFKLAHALVKRGRETGLPGAAEYDLRPLLDLVALGTIADLVPLTGENRILVSAGLRRLDSDCRPGLTALKRVAQCPAPLGVYEVAFQLAPRLNAAGRLESAEESLNLLLAREPAEAARLAGALDSRNRERQRIEREISEEAIAHIEARFQAETDFVIVEGRLNWHAGVVGIVASRVLHKFYRPTIIVGGEGGEWRGSGRSIQGFDLAAALRECGELLVRHGGHAMAAGLTIREENLPAFRKRLNDVARRLLAPEAMQPPLRLDAEVGLDELHLECLGALSRLQPSGNGNPPVHLVARGLTHQRPLQRVGAQKQHVKFWVTDNATTREAIWWGAGNESLPVGRFDLAFTPQINNYNGSHTVQLKVLDWRPA